MFIERPRKRGQFSRGVALGAAAKQLTSSGEEVLFWTGPSISETQQRGLVSHLSVNWPTFAANRQTRAKQNLLRHQLSSSRVVTIAALSGRDRKTGRFQIQLDHLATWRLTLVLKANLARNRDVCVRDESPHSNVQLSTLG